VRAFRKKVFKEKFQDLHTKYGYPFYPHLSKEEKLRITKDFFVSGKEGCYNIPESYYYEN